MIEVETLIGGLGGDYPIPKSGSGGGCTVKSQPVAKERAAASEGRANPDRNIDAAVSH